MLFPAVGAPLFTLQLGSNGAGASPLPLPIGLPPGPYFLQGLVIDAGGSVQLPGLTLSATRGRAIELF